MLKVEYTSIYDQHEEAIEDCMKAPFKSWALPQGCAKTHFVDDEDLTRQEKTRGSQEGARQRIDYMKKASLFNDTSFCQRNALLLALQAKP